MSLVGLAAAACSVVRGPVALTSPSPTYRPSAAPTEAAPTLAPTAAPTPTEPPPTPAVLLAAGDISSCGNDNDEATARLIEARQGTVAMLGDSAYDRGSPEEFAGCYDPTWGRFRDRTRPTVGNHEYLTPGASGYFAYFGESAGPAGLGYYSYDLGAWPIIVLNSMCWEVGGCTADDPQAVWLAEDLRAHPAECTLAYWHFPRYSSGRHGSMDVVDAYWDLLYQAGAEIVLTGHDHSYERFAPLDDRGIADPARGLREFVVGTGGGSHYGFPLVLPNSEVRDAATFGVLVLTLFEDHYTWEFVPVEGKSFLDRGEGTCHP
jgi:hypothetical protein